MKTKNIHLKRYIYISSRKINMFDQQRRENLFWRWLKSWFTRTNRLKVKDIEMPALTSAVEFDKLTTLLATLEREHTIGTVDQPAEYIKGTLPMFYRLIPSRSDYHRAKNDPGFVYFGGSTAKSIIALVGSPFHLNGKVRDITEEPSSDLPQLVAYLNERLSEIVDKHAKIPDNDSGIFAIEHAEHMNKDPRIPMEFFASRILDTATMQGLIHGPDDKRLLLYTPLYVAYAPDPPAHP